MNDAAQEQVGAAVWGGVTIAGMSLALPLAALREVVPLQPLAPLPCEAPGVIGGLALRGVTVPVLDLARWLGRSAAASASCVVTVVHDGRMLGLLADGVSGIFTARESASGPQPLGGSPFGGSLRRGDTGELVNALALPALAEATGLPWIADPEPQRLLRADDASAEGTDAAPPSRLALMLVRCGRLALAIEALAVHATLWGPRVDRSVLGRGACRGTIDVDGHRIAAVDLLALCGLGALPPEGERQALVVRDAQGGMVAMLVEQVMDIVDVAPERVVPVPAQALAGTALLRGVMDGQVLRAETLVSRDTREHDFLVVDAAALQSLDEMRNLARTNTRIADSAGEPAARRETGIAAAAGGAPSVITLRLPAELAVPMDQVLEILPYGTRDAMFGPDEVLRRIQVLRGRSLPVYCLARLCGGTVDRIDSSAAVLVVELDGELAGFGVPALRHIEAVHARQRLSALVPDEGAPRHRLATRETVTVGGRDGVRTLPLLDLHAIARRLRAQRPADTALAA